MYTQIDNERLRTMRSTMLFNTRKSLSDYLADAEEVLCEKIRRRDYDGYQEEMSRTFLMGDDLQKVDAELERRARNN